MIFINILGLSLIVLIIWWFWLYKPKGVAVSEEGIVVTVENGVYQPARIKLPARKPVTIQFLRKDASPCAATVLIPELEIAEELPLNKSRAIRLPAMNKGEYAFHCQMQMYKGLFVVE